MTALLNAITGRSKEYLAFDSPGVEVVKPDEDDKIREICDLANKCQSRNLSKHGHCFRTTHVKTIGIVKGSLSIPELPKHLAQGMFSLPGTYPVVGRYANEPIWMMPDQSKGPKGLGIKIFNLFGERLPDGQDLKTQDFMFNNDPMLELTDLDTTLEIFRLREKHFEDPQGSYQEALEERSDTKKQQAPFQLESTNIISHTMYTQSAFRFGEYYGHFGLFPSGSDQTSEKSKVKDSDPEDVLRNWFEDYFKLKPAKYDLKVQLATDVKLHPAEDASIVWDPKSAPWHTIGFLEFAPQPTQNKERWDYWQDRMQLNPWQGLAAHRPLGSVNRLRKTVYEASAKYRAEKNGVELVRVNDINAVPPVLLLHP